MFNQMDAGHASGIQRFIICPRGSSVGNVCLTCNSMSRGDEVSPYMLK